MIVYDLICENGHEFEGWFKDSGSYEVQETKGLIACAYCNSNKIKRLLRGRSIKSKEVTENTPSPPNNTPIEYYKQYQQLKNYIVKHFENVGENFAEEARKMYNGEAEKKNIRGTTTEDEEKDLKEEGIPFLKLPSIKYDS